MKKVEIMGLIPDIEVKYQPPQYEDEGWSQEGEVYLGREILASGIIPEVESQGYIHWVVDEIKINPNAKYIFWLSEDINLGKLEAMQNTMVFAEYHR